MVKKLRMEQTAASTGGIFVSDLVCISGRCTDWKNFWPPYKDNRMICCGVLIYVELNHIFFLAPFGFDSRESVSDLDDKDFFRTNSYV